MKTKLFLLLLVPLWIASPVVEACTTFLMKDAKGNRIRRGRIHAAHTGDQCTIL